MKSDRSSISYLMWFAFPVFIFFVSVVPLSILFEPISGDLTRIGHWSERDFGWNKPQPTVSVRANKTAISNPQVLVLGDSFSHPHIWQSYLAESHHIEILSFQYQDVGCLDNWLHWVTERHYPNMRTVVIQTVERSFVPLFRNLNTCPRRVPKSFEITENNILETRPHSGLMLDAGYLFPTAANMLRMAWSDSRISSGGVVNVPLTTGRFFSNRKSNRLLYYAEDESKLSWSKKDIAAAIATLKQIQDNLAKKGLRMVLVVVPDKSSVYRQYVTDKTGIAEYPNVFEQLTDAGVNNVNLLNSFQQAVEGTVDLYLPNDTHLGTQGYKLMASKVANEFF
jgi:hypothetical protein